MNKVIVDKVRGTMSKYDVEIDEDILRKIVYELKPVYKQYFLSKLPTIKEIEDELAIQPAKSSNYANGIAVGAKKIIEHLQNL